ncbi:hypothetical protein Vafri_18866 [Volvox africanus]|uniref:Ion transport domain-containing protein n=1 Tax=Volvox africanus TaxID=51714 RepID=A0A8J4BP56_9CHLO|nr:hypothetical protein Vafri_18866 [Volvox africanus]
MLTITNGGSGIRHFNILNLHPPTIRQPLAREELSLALAEMFPGLAVIPNPDGNTLLHAAVATGDLDLLRGLLTTNTSVIISAPLPLNAKDETPLDVALSMPNNPSQFVQLLLDNELKRPPHLRLAARKAFHHLAKKVPDQLLQFLTKMGAEGRNIEAAKRFGDFVSPEQGKPANEDTVRNTDLKAGQCGLPYLATVTRKTQHSPLGVLVANKLDDALNTDIGTAMIMYTWKTYARPLYLLRASLYVFFIVLYIVSTTLGVSWNPKVDRESMYGNNTSHGQVATRVVFQASVQLINLWYLWTELTEMKGLRAKHGLRLGLRKYLAGSGSLWNWLELSSSILVIVVLVLQVANVQAAYWAMSACTLLLGARVLKVLLVFKETGIYVRIIFLIIANIRYYLLIVLVTLLTYGLSFRQIVVYYNQAANNAIPGEFTRDFDTYPKSLLSAYYFMVGSVNTNTGDEAKYVWYLHVMLISFSFIVSIILLNLLISIMSDTYANAKKRAEMEWRKFILRDMLEDVSTNTPKYFFKYGRLGPMWIPLIDSWMEEYGHKLHKDWFREARNADIKNVKMQVSDVKKQVSDMREQISDIKEQMVSLQQDIGRLTSALLANSKGGVGLLLEDDEPTGAGGNTGGGGK